VKRNALLLIGFLVVSGLLGCLCWLLVHDSTQTTSVPTSDPPSVIAAKESNVDPTAALPEPKEVGTEITPERTFDVATTNEDRVPQSYERALAGVTGRVIEETGEPVKGIAVTLLQVFLSDWMSGDLQRLFDEGLTSIPLEVGSGVTDDEGRFLIPGAECRGFQGLGVDLGGPRAALRVVDHALHNGEKTDVGDIVLVPFVTFVGKVVDPDGKPVCAARVRATDLPAVIFNAGVQHFRSQSRLLLDENPKAVIEIPAWLLAYESKLPFPSTRSGEDGSFQLAGVPQGLVTVVVDHPDWVASTRAFPTGKKPQKDVGELLLARGRILSGTVFDALGRAVPQAEVLGGVMSPLGEVAISGPPVRSDEHGRFRVEAMPADGEAMFAARRTPGMTWAVIGPEPLSSDATIVLPAAFSLSIEARDSTGKLVPEVDLLLRPQSEMDQIPFLAFHFNSYQKHPAADGTLRLLVDNGEYIIVGRSKRLGISVAEATVENADASVEILFGESQDVTVKVLDDATSEPVEYALVTIEEAKSEFFFPTVFGVASRRTNKEGIAPLGAIAIRAERKRLLSIQHPAYSNVTAELSREAVQEFRLTPGGTLHGKVLYGGQPTAGLYMLAVTPNMDKMERLADFSPRLAVTDPLGDFRISHLRPGKYEYHVVKRFLDSEATKVLSGAIAENFEPEDVDDGEFEIEAGKITELMIDLSPAAQGGTATIRGRVTVNGAPMKGARAQTSGRSRRSYKYVETDEAGNYEISGIPVGEMNFQVSSNDSNGWDSLHSEQVELVAGDLKIIDVDVRSIPVTVHVIDDDGNPVEGANVSCTETSQKDDTSWSSSQDDGVAHLHFRRPGTYLVHVQHDEKGMGQMSLDVPEAGLSDPVRIELSGGVPCAGIVVIDGSESVDPTEIRWLAMSINAKSDPSAPMWKQLEYNDSRRVPFEIHGLSPGEYRASLFTARGMHEPVEFALPVGGDRSLELHFKLSRQGLGEPTEDR